jgi:putative Holliday junction resolvase
MAMSAKPRIIGLDVGDERIGVAISDPQGITAAGLETIERTNLRRDIGAVCDMAKRHGAVQIVVGLPKNVDGSVGEHAHMIQAFCRKLARASGLPIVYEDERLTTVSNIRTLTLQGVRAGENNGSADRQTAAIILQKHLDRHEPPPIA